MNKIQQLIAELFPNSVSFKKLGEVCEISRGVRVVKSQLEVTGKYPVYQNCMTPLGYYDRKNCNANTTFVIVGGAAGQVGFCNVDFWAADDCLYLNCPQELNSKFLYYSLICKQDFLLSQVRKASVPRLSRTVIEKLPIPIPPLSIQLEIVNILDKFTELVAKLEAELEAELEARKKQYEYYRERLMINDKWLMISLVEIIISLKTGLNPRQNFKLNTPDAENYYVTVRELDGVDIVFYDKTDRVNDEALRLINNRSNLETGDVLFSGTGTVGKTALVKEKPENWNIKEGVYVIKPKQEKINPLFLLYYLNTEQAMKQVENKIVGSPVCSIPMAELKKIKIPLPPLEEQNRIVAILDKFDALVNDISAGLPAEIKMRRAQYEYYRNKLLTFNKVA